MYICNTNHLKVKSRIVDILNQQFQKIANIVKKQKKIENFKVKKYVTLSEFVHKLQIQTWPSLI